jgi:hypothetical protein
MLSLNMFKKGFSLQHLSAISAPSLLLIDLVMLPQLSCPKPLGNNMLCLKYFHINVSFQALTRNKRNIAQGNGHVIGIGTTLRQTN